MDKLGLYNERCREELPELVLKRIEYYQDMTTRQVQGNTGLIESTRQQINLLDVALETLHEGGTISNVREICDLHEVRHRAVEMLLILDGVENESP